MAEPVPSGESGKWGSRHSDHRPIIVECREREPNQVGRKHAPKSEAKWLEEDCICRVEKAWTDIDAGAVTLVDIQRNILGDLKERDRNVLGVLEKRISRLKKELEICRRATLSQENVNVEHVLRFKLDRLQEQLHIYCKQRAHSLWLTKGHRNTMFFFIHVPQSVKEEIILRRSRGKEAMWWRGRDSPFITNHF